MNLKTEANPIGSTPTAQVAVESTDQPLTNHVKLFEVTVGAEVQLTLSGRVNVYATNKDEAEQKVQQKLEDETLDDDLEMEDCDSGYTMRYGDIMHICNVDFQIDGAEVIEDDVDPSDVLQLQVKNLQASVPWNTDALAKHKAFLESLLNDGSNKQVVAA